MKDFGRSDHPGVQAQLDRLGMLSVPQGRLGLETVTALLDRLGNPHLQLPPVFHVAGTNGKGSTCAFLRAMLEAQGYTVHATISPHLVRYNERIRIAGELISDEALAAVLMEVLDAGEDLGPSFFEVTIAAAFLCFSRTPADACVVEVGMGGRFDATNVIPRPLVCGIAALGLDHERFLLAPEQGVPTEPMARIAFEKAGIAKRGVPLVTIAQPELEMSSIRTVANEAGAPIYLAESTYDELSLSLRGQHQRLNAGLAIAMLRHQSVLPVTEDAIRAGLANARWPARLQRLSHGPLIGAREVWLDGGHNPNAAEAIARQFDGQKLHLVVGMIAGKDPGGFMAPLANLAQSIAVVPVSAHEFFGPEAFGPAARGFPDVASALAALPGDGLPVLIAGSLYLAGDVLRLNGELPD